MLSYVSVSHNDRVDKHLSSGVEYRAQEQPDELCIFGSKCLDVVELSLPLTNGGGLHFAPAALIQNCS